MGLFNRRVTMVYPAAEARTRAVLTLRTLESMLEYRLLSESEQKELAKVLVYLYDNEAPNKAREIKFPNWDLVRKAR